MAVGCFEGGGGGKVRISCLIKKPVPGSRLERAEGGSGELRRRLLPRPLRLPSALGVGLLSRKQRLRSQQRRAFGKLHIGD